MRTALGSALAIVLLGLAAASMRAESYPQAAASKAEVEALLRSAHSPVQYHTLAVYFHQKQTAYEVQAQAEKAEWERRSQNVVGVAAKYPRPVDSSRNRYTYFMYEADRMAHQAAHFDALAEAQ
jgi:hypothetical protein